MQNDNRSTRRSFLHHVGQIGAASMLGPFCLREPQTRADAPSTLPALTTQFSTSPIDESAKSIVVHIRAPDIMAGQIVHKAMVAEMVEEAIIHITGKEEPADAWHALLKPDDVIALKFNHVGADMLGTTLPFARQIVESLKKAGFAPDKMILIEAPEQLTSELKTRPMVHGWSGEEVSFGSGKDQLAAVLQEATAIINVPFLKTHNIAGMTGCLKNLSHALIRRPGRFHANACAPFVGDIVSLPQIRNKLRLNIVNALRAVYDGGPEAKPDGIWQHCGVLISKDPVAADTVGLELINDQRRLAKLPPIGDAMGRIPHVSAAAHKGLGTDDHDYIRFLEPKLY